jgi:NAD(P)-dependent dehydrogenase (short-subunit alcohol dehydrogenase family)
MANAIIVGVGPGLGAALARRFARGGCDVALMARSESSLAPVAKEVEGLGRRAVQITVDAGDAASVASAFARAKAELGAADVLVYNAGAFKMGSLLELKPEDFESCLRINCTGGFLASREVLPDMVARGRGTVLFTGATASLRGSGNFACLAVGKFGLRALAQSMARELGPRGVHVAHVVIDGQIATPRARAMWPDRDPSTLLSPEAIAETYWQLHVQDKTCWTLELDIRPNSEKF